MKTILFSLIATVLLASCSKTKQGHKCESQLTLKGESVYVCQFTVK